MSRMARVVVPGLPHHVTQRGARRKETFFGPADYAEYLSLIARACKRCGTRVWAYCLMPNHVHFVMVPSTEEGLRAALGDPHRRYAASVNERFGWQGHLWQDRFHSFPMDEAHLLAAVRYIERNPVAAGLTRTADEWPWSSAHAHLAARDDDLVEVAPMLERIADWSGYLETPTADAERDAISRHSRSGRPLGGKMFVAELERHLLRRLTPLPSGRKPRDRNR
ncbi:MAG: transposase [Gammaproteobacteria bacterium]